MPSEPRLATDDPVHRHFDNAQLRAPRGETLVEDLVENLRVRVFAFQNGFPVAFLPRFERGGILILGLGNGHTTPPYIIWNADIIVHARDDFNTLDKTPRAALS